MNIPEEIAIALFKNPYGRTDKFSMLCINSENYADFRKRGVSKGIAKPRTDAMTVFEPLMKGKGPLTLDEVALLFKGKKSKCAVYNCLRNTLEPKGLVVVGYRPYKGSVEFVTYEWVGK